MRPVHVIALLFVFALTEIACRTTITPDMVKQIKLCVTTHKELEEMLGGPDQVGRLGDRTTWRYNASDMADAYKKPPKLLLLFAADDSRVADLAYNPSGIVELRDRCEKSEPKQ